MKRTFSLALVLAFGLVTSVANAGFVLGAPTETLWSWSGFHTLWGGGPSISNDGLSLFFYGDFAGTGLEEMYPGYGSGDLYVMTRPSKVADWGKPTNLGPTVNSSANDGAPDISADGLTLYFYSTRFGGSGGRDLWMTTRPTTDADWTEPVNLGSTVNSSSDDNYQSISTDGCTLYFASDRSGNGDLLVTTRPTIDDPWGEPVNLGPTVNSSTLIDWAPSISADGRTLFFTSARPGGYGGVWGDTWMTTRPSEDADWGEPVNLGPTVNGSYNETEPDISADGSTLYFGSNRSDGWGVWEAPITLVVDFNGDSKVNLADFCKLAENWCGDNSSADIAPAPLGDGRVDIEDIAAFAENWLRDVRLLAHWKLDETEGAIARDFAGDYDGTLKGAPVWQPAGGKIGGALQLNGTNDYVGTPLVLDPAAAPFSALAWVKGGAAGQVIISQTDGSGWGSPWLCVDSEDGKLATGLMRPWDAPEKSEFVVTDGDWHHVGLVWDGSFRHLYVDGAEVAKDAVALSYTLSCDGGLNLGAGKTLDAGTLFSGLIDDVRIYNEPLSAEEIEALAP